MPAWFMRSKGFSLVELLVAISIMGLLFAGMAVAFANVQVLYERGTRGGPLLLAREGLEATRGLVNAADCIAAPAHGGRGDLLIVASGAGLSESCAPEQGGVASYAALCLSADGVLWVRRVEGAASMPGGLASCSDTSSWSPLFPPEKLRVVGHQNGIEPIFKRLGDRNRVDLDGMLAWRLESSLIPWRATFVTHGAVQ